MKNLLLTIVLLSLLAPPAFAQSNAILFTENGEKFTVILNGVRQNEKPETNVKITGLNAEFYKLKVIFEDVTLGEKNMNLYINVGSETSYSIRKNNKGEYVLRLISEVPVAQAPVSPPAQYIVAYSANPAATSQSVTTQTTTTTHGNPDQVNFNMGINVGNNGGNISIQASENATEQTSAVTHTTTTVTHTTSSGRPVPNHDAVTYVPGYNGPFGCPIPVSHSEFQDIRSSISSKTFEDTRLTIARQVISDRCVITSQVKEIMLLFTFEDNRLEFAKYAYDKVYDTGNYYKVNDAFTFESSTDELNQYINSRR